MNCIIVDDEATARAILNQLCSAITGLNVIAEFENVDQVIDFLKHKKVDLILLDIHMPDFSGFDFINALENGELKQALTIVPKIIFTTSDKNFAIESYEYDFVMDYLLKPILPNRFNKAIKKVKKTVSQKSKISLASNSEKVSDNQLFINIDKRLIKIDVSSICLVEAKGDYINLKTDKTNYIVHSSLKKIKDKLPTSLFFRVHRSYIINVHKITGIEDNTVLINKDLIPISRSSKTELMKRINLL
ncbi:MAG: LytTR family DNA-binding domain-containing protein [Algibacter sp.]|uniref:LytR/AlgR family response regulator transcription factor n=1 Tax=Algibacter sp. TaxID=1872428 RepID=UPI002622FF96|nr:LytTR family DNA-binding domain-containing protein [Algibacter sp.]MDG1731069.1 LytTR family DNA-binding domain-containing protein [Algibacter sp.]MDG2178396.1 LytTR family DNA-binding domain-containing protein [Algibacter sp.]